MVAYSHVPFKGSFLGSLFLMKPSKDLIKSNHVSTKIGLCSRYKKSIPQSRHEKYYIIQLFHSRRHNKLGRYFLSFDVCVCVRYVKEKTIFVFDIIISTTEISFILMFREHCS